MMVFWRERGGRVNLGVRGFWNTMKCVLEVKMRKRQPVMDLIDSILEDGVSSLGVA